MYRIIGPDGKEYGPTDENGLRQWVAEGRIHPTTTIIDAAGTRSAAGNLPALQPLFANPNVPPVLPGAGAAGPPAKKKNPVLVGCGGCLGVLVLISIIGAIVGDKGSDAGSGNTASPPSSSAPERAARSEPAPEPADLTITARALSSAYKENAVAADNMYKDKTLIISGTVERVGKDIVDTMYVVLTGDDMVNGVQCMFDDKYNSAVASLKKGQSIRVKGVCTGDALLNVVIRDCEPM